jgi:hypothetical protein
VISGSGLRREWPPKRRDEIDIDVDRVLTNYVLQSTPCVLTMTSVGLRQLETGIILHFLDQYSVDNRSVDQY